MNRKPVLQETALLVVKRFLWSLLFPLMFPLPSLALGPMSSFQDLVAGDLHAGLINGTFYTSRFNSPCGMTINPEGTRLYIADRGNHCIRMVDLEHSNQVTTLAGTGAVGNKDGSLTDATFSQPNEMAYLPDEQIAVSDEGDFCIRLINLKSKNVTTIVGNGQNGVSDGEGRKAQAGDIYNMVYLASQGKLYFTQPDYGALRALDIKTLQVTTVIRGKSEIPRPTALCGYDNKLYMVDQSGQQVFEGLPISIAGQGTTFTWSPFAQGEKIESLAWSGKILYAIQRVTTAPLARLTPAYQPVTFISIWGKTIQEPSLCAFFSEVNGDTYKMALVPDPQSDRKLYLSHSVLNIVTSYRDLSMVDFQKTNTVSSGGLYDYEYPRRKPPRTFRILLFGDSRTATNIHDDPHSSPDGVYGDRSVIMSKRLETALNMMASLLDVPTRFEVLHYWKVSYENFNIWSYYALPELAQTYDVDMVLGVFTPNFDLESYFDKPLTDQGIPADKFDPEFILKPIQERIRNGTPKKLLDLGLAKKICTINPENKIQWVYQPFPTDPEFLDCAAQMFSEPIALFKKKLNEMKTSQGKPIRLVEALLPAAGVSQPQMGTAFFRNVVEKAQVDYIDLSPEMNSYRISFYPFSEISEKDHFTTEGHLLVSYWLAFELLHRKIIPFKSSYKGF